MTVIFIEIESLKYAIAIIRARITTTEVGDTTIFLRFASYFLRIRRRLHDGNRY